MQKAPLKKKYHQLTVIREIRQISKSTGFAVRTVLCRCSCGKKKIFILSNLKAGFTKSCGCRKQSRSHGKVKTGAYRSWQSMLERCRNHKNKDYPRYGGRGIKVCRRWMDFKKFYEDMGPRPANKSIDRKNNNRGYSPANCRWATTKQQTLNKRKPKASIGWHYLNINGNRMSIAKAARKYRIPYSTLRARIRYGWPVKDSILVPVVPGQKFSTKRKKYLARKKEKCFTRKSLEAEREKT